MLRHFGIITTVLSALVAAAHFMRSGSYFLIAISLSMPLLLLFRKTWATRIVQGALGIAVVIWINTLLTLAAQRQADGQPWMRMAIILGVVAGMAGLSAILLNLKRKQPVLDSEDRDKK